MNPTTSPGDDPVTDNYHIDIMVPCRIEVSPLDAASRFEAVRYAGDLLRNLTLCVTLGDVELMVTGIARIIGQ